MLSLLRTLSFRYLRQRWTRAALIVVSIALGVATLVATRAVNQSITSAAQEATSPMAGFADLHVDNGDAGVRADLRGRLQAVAGVQAVEPMIVERIALTDLGHRPALLIGLGLRDHMNQLANPGSDAPVDNPWGVQVEVTNLLALLPGRKPVLVGKDLAEEINGPVRVLANGIPVELTPLGTVSAQGAAALLGKNILIMDTADAAALLGRSRGLVTRLDVFLDKGADREQVRRDLETTLAGQALVRTPEAHGQALQEVMAGLQIGLSLCGAGALVVGLFLVYNALSVSVTERRHDIGILRSLGATRSQVAGLFAAEATLLGLVGALLGVPLGLGVAWLTLGPVQHALNQILLPMDAHQVMITWGTQLGAMAAGMATALVAALVPALRAARDEPADAVRRAPRALGLASWLLLLSSSAALVGLGVAAFALRGWLPERLGTYGSLVLMLLGLLLLAPLLSALATRLLLTSVRRWLGLEVRLAADNLARSPGRTGLVIGSLAATVALMVQTAGVTHSNEGPILAWVERTVTADLYVTSGPLNNGNLNLPLRAAVAREIEAIPGVDRALGFRFRHPDYGHTIVCLSAFDARAYYDLNRARGNFHVQDLELFPRLCEPNTVLISENFAALHGVKENDVIELAGPSGPLGLRVVGVVVDYSWNRGSVIVDMGTYHQHFEDDRVDVFDVYLQPGAEIADVRPPLQEWAGRQTLVVTDHDEVCDYIRSVIRRVYGLAYLQEIIVGIVAALGVITALLISVLQRQRELGLLRAVGATRAQVVRSLLAEAVLMGLIGTGIGVLIGVPLEWYILNVVILEETGFLFPMSVPWRETLGIAALALLTATLAGLGPALHTLWLRIPEAIAYE